MEIPEIKVYATKLNVRSRANNKYNVLWTQGVLKDLLISKGSQINKCELYEMCQVTCSVSEIRQRQ